MRYAIYTLAIGLLASVAYDGSAQTMDLHWSKTYQSTAISNEYYLDGVHYATSDGGFIWAGEIGTVSNDIMLVKFNSGGVKTWEQILDGSNDEHFIDMKRTPDGGYLLACNTNSHDGDFSDSPASDTDGAGAIIKLNSSGIVIWVTYSSYYETEEMEIIYKSISAIEVMPDGSCLASETYGAMCGCGGIFGCAFGYPCTVHDLAHYDSNGTPLANVYTGHFGSPPSILATTFGQIVIQISDVLYSYSAISLELLWSYERTDFAIENLCESSDGFLYVSGAKTELVFLGMFSFTSSVNAAITLLDANGDEVYYLELPEMNGVLYNKSGSITATENGGCALTLGNQYLPFQIVGYSNTGNLEFAVLLPTGSFFGSLDYFTGGIYSVFGLSDTNGFSASALALVKLGPTAIATSNPSDINLCNGQPIDVNWTATSEIQGTFIVQLSNSSGNFSNPNTIGMGTTSPIACIIPSNTPAGSGYHVRTSRMEPALIGAVNAANITIAPFQLPAIVETMGNSGANTSITTYEASNGFDNDNLTMSGTATVVNSNASMGYPGASGGVNVLIGNAASTSFQIAGINTTGPNTFSVSFGYYRNNTSGSISSMLVEVSADGTTYTQLNYSYVNTTGWQLVNATGLIPSTDNLRLRFIRQTGASGLQLSIDDVKISSVTPSLDLSIVGDLNFCGGQGSVQLTGPATGNWLWSTGATTQSITVQNTGTYYCQTTAADGCVAQTPSAVVTNALTVYYLDADGDDFGVAQNSLELCAASGNYTTTQSGDCDDANPAINTGAIEQCNGIDDNCNGMLDEGFDVDADGYHTCEGDCDDNNPYIHPGMVELINNVDDNCDGAVDTPPTHTWYLDNDGDGYGTPFIVSNAATIPSGYSTNYLDCDDDDTMRFPTADDGCGDNIDNNCDGIVDNCECVGDFDDNGAVNVIDLLLFTSAFGNVCNIN